MGLQGLFEYKRLCYGRGFFWVSKSILQTHLKKNEPVFWYFQHFKKTICKQHLKPAFTVGNVRHPEY